YCPELGITMPDFSGKEMRQRSRSHLKGLDRGTEFGRFFSDFGRMGDALYCLMNMFLENEAEENKLAKRYKGLYVPEEIIQAGLKQLQDRQPLSALGKLITGAYIDCAAGLLKAMKLIDYD